MFAAFCLFLEKVVKNYGYFVTEITRKYVKSVFAALNTFSKKLPSYFHSYTNSL